MSCHVILIRRTLVSFVGIVREMGESSRQELTQRRVGGAGTHYFFFYYYYSLITLIIYNNTVHNETNINQRTYNQPQINLTSWLASKNEIHSISENQSKFLSI
mmetsp:Transcript_11318/g.17139  ORF Transcript_11318/g.17139 Transcript_11318/m.17139 type:complete len:103 (+) Transcript_11318:2046-2354(+)